MYINEFTKCVVLQVFLRLDFYNIIFKIKHKVCTDPGSASTHFPTLVQTFEPVLAGDSTVRACMTVLKVRPCCLWPNYRTNYVHRAMQRCASSFLKPHLLVYDSCDLEVTVNYLDIMVGLLCRVIVLSQGP